MGDAISTHRRASPRAPALAGRPRASLASRGKRYGSKAARRERGVCCGHASGWRGRTSGNRAGNSAPGRSGTGPADL